MADQISFLVIGNGIAGITAAETLRQEAPQASIGVISEDGHPVYFRPALKDYLAGRVVEEKLWARPINYYQSQHIHFLAEKVMRIQPEQHIVLLQSGGQVKYEKLLLASGARPAHLTCPGSDLEGVFTLRSVEDYQAIVERLPAARRIVVVGSGTLALETVETLRHRGHQVSHLLRKSLLWSEVLDATASDLVLQEETRDGVDVRLETEVTEIVGSRGGVSAVQTSTGERITCDLVLVAIGIEPNIDYAQASGLQCRRGLLVDDQMRTSAIDVYAAGDVVETTMPGTQRARIIGQWYPSIQQARAAAYSMLNILDTDRPFHAATFYNATFLYGLPFASVGLTNVKGYRELVAEPQPRSYRKVLLCDGVPVGMLALGDRKHTLAFKRAIDYQVNLAPVASALMKEDFDLTAYLDRLQVPPLQLGVQRAGGTDTRQIAIPGNGQEPQAGEDPMLHELLPSQHTEALLVHVADPHVPLHIAETALSREKFVTIGRQPGVNLVVNEGSISRRHAQLGFQNGHYVVIDLRSLNGTFLNEQRLDPERPYPLKVNDVLRFGNTVTFCFLLRPLNFDNLAPTRQKISAEPEPQPARQQQQELDENLLPIGAAQPLPPALMKALKATPALIILPASVKGERKQSPYVHLLKPKASITIGREAGNDLEIHDMMISRRHAEVFSTMEGFYMRDLGSSNGVTVNQGRIDQPYRLSHGDRIILGSTTIFFIDLQSGQEKTSKLQSMAINPPVQRSPLAKSTKGSPAARPPVTGTETQIRVPAVAPARSTKPAVKPPFPVVICPKCGVVNMPVARFCAGCSSPLHSS